jgi:hypothetical protein
MRKNQQGVALLLPILIALLLIGVVAFFAYQNHQNINPQPIPDKPQITNQPTVSSTPNNTKNKQHTEPNIVNNPTSALAPTTPPFKSITVSGFAYEDRADDGIYNSDDPKLPNMQIYFIDSYNSQTVSTVFTNSSGNFNHTVSVRGNLVLRPSAYNNFVPKSDDKTLSTSANNLEFRFRSASAPVPNQNIGILEGNVFHDANRNLTRDAGESSVRFYKLYLKDSSGNYFNTVQNAQTTDDGGHFKYINLPIPNTFTLQLSNPTGAFEILKANTNITLDHNNPQNTNIEIPVYKY